MSRLPALTLLAVLLAGCAGAPPEAPAAGLRQALERAAADPAAWDSLHLFVECEVDDAWRSMEVFGPGLGVWNGERQFRLGPEQVRALLRALRDADLPALADRYGGSAGHPPPEPGDVGGELMVTVLTCRVDLALGGHEKEVVQFARGEQSQVLKTLARDLLALGEASAREGVGAASLREGLEKIARGELAPETWRILLHRRQEGREEPAGRPGFLLTIAGPQASTRLVDPAEGYTEPQTRELTQEQVRTLARELAARDPGAWPGNLYAPDYLDLTVKVLNHEKSVQARRFAGLEPATHGRHQEQLDEVLALLERLLPTPTPAPPPAPPGR